MPDLFPLLKQFQTVASVSHLYPETADRPLDLFFFVCPKTRSGGFRLNQYATGLTVNYAMGLTAAVQERIARTARFLSELDEKLPSVRYYVSCVFASADALILFPIPVEPPPIPKGIEMPIISNYPIVLAHFALFGHLCGERPWEKAKQTYLDEERERLKKLLPAAPENIVLDFVNRSFAGFALDGILARKGCFGSNPVLLAVEGRGVAQLQNTALPREAWLPSVELK